ncbi:hypothetical protein FGG08_006017 [Glutinoglossum americanum]|uniref:Uncharacterized protein n=1 Tax=Glutinoglossum americanum TaxID=1670608 RepID=A0A9P8L0V7_9PEZI|nr:hypothetical protein FGG08_006017 [Glutinoglossum americanum]
MASLGQQEAPTPPKPEESEQAPQDPDTVPKDHPKRRSVWSILSRSPPSHRTSPSSNISHSRPRRHVHPYLRKSPSASLIIPPETVAGRLDKTRRRETIDWPLSTTLPRASTDSKSTSSSGLSGLPIQTFPHRSTRPTNMSTPDPNGNQSGAPNLSRESTRETREQEGPQSARDPPRTAGSNIGFSPGVQTPGTAAAAATAGGSTPPSSGALSGLVCNVYRTTGKEPHPLVGATTTILGDTLYVFGGRILSRTRPHLTADLYALDLISRHWTKVDVRGEIPAPRYFHSVCALGNTKLVCYGGMSPSALPPGGASLATQQQQQQGGPDQQPEVGVMSDIHIFDVPTRTWAFVPTIDAPQGRYAHCATILASSAIFSSANAPLSAIQHNPSTGNPNQGSIGVTLDGTGGAEMVIVGGQDCANHYIEQISVFNLRSLKWTVTSPLGKSCGAYRSVVSPLTGISASRIGRGGSGGAGRKSEVNSSGESPETGSSMLIYSNYNFLDVKLELQVRLPDGTLSEKHMHGHFSPPGLRFPNGGVIDGHFVVSGTYLTSSKQEYALWALDLRTLTWSRIDAGGSVFSQGSWNRGLLWNRRNTFVILGNNKRSLVEDYNHRRINFSNLCMVELEAFGLYENPRRTSPLSGYTSVSAPAEGPPASLPQQRGVTTGWTGGGRPVLAAAEELGRLSMGLRELADMDFIAFGGERLPVNSRIIARRWGPYFVQLLKDGAANQDTDTETLRPPLPQRGESQMSQVSSATITPSLNNSSISSGSTVTGHTAGNASISSKPLRDHLPPPTPHGLPPMSRPRTLYLPHTHLSLQALVHYFYVSSLPAPSHPLCTPQILCSLLQLARPYQIDGLLEACVERLHQVLDGRNAASIFNAAAMAAGGGRGVGFAGGWGAPSQSTPGLDGLMAASSAASSTDNVADTVTGETKTLRINTSVANSNRAQDDEISSASTGGGGSSATGSSEYSSYSDTVGEDNRGREPWAGELSAVIGLQKRGLRGLLEGRKLRERGRSQGAVATHASTGSVTTATTTTTMTTAASGTGSVGLGIA